MEKKKITKAEVEKVMDSPEAKMFRKTLNEFLEQSKEQWNSYKRNVCMWLCTDCPIKAVKCFVSTNEYSWVNNKDMYSDKFLDQEIEIEETDILDEAEKRYLKAVIRPFRDRVISISKYFYVFDNAYAIDICVISSVTMKIFEKEIIRLPLFQNEMYKGMENNKSYTLEELDL